MNTFYGFGLIYGDFLKERGDEITATTFIHGVFGTMFSFMGLINQLFLVFNYSDLIKNFRITYQ